MADVDILDQVTKNAPWLIIPATLLTAAPKLLELWQGFAGTHDGRKQLEIENARLENLKLLVEIEAIKKEHGIELPEEINLAGLLSSSALTATRQGITRKPVEKKVWGWLGWLGKKWPRTVSVTAIFLSLACIWMGSFIIFGIIAGGIAEWFDEKAAPGDFTGYVWVASIGGLIPAFLLLKFGYSLKTQRKLLKNALRPPQT
jgi:uncharacterized membrane protein YeaQ/YmgE (transglycosylase-associated protein family)